MERMKQRLYFSPTEFSGTDGAAIQAAVDEAERTGVATVLIPARETPWTLDRTIQLPHDMTVILDGCTVEAPFPAFCNAKAGDGTTRKLAEERQYLFLQGRRGATLRGTGEQPQVVLINVRDFLVDGITFAGGDGLFLSMARCGKVMHLRFEKSGHGIVLGEGCSDLIVENVEAVTKQEAILARSGPDDYFGRSMDICNNILCRIRAKTDGAPAVALYAGERDLYNVVVRDVTDATRAGASVRIGDAGDKGKVHDLTVRGVKGKRTCVQTGCACESMFYSNLHGAKELDAQVKNKKEVLDHGVMEIVEPAFPAYDERPWLSPNDPEFYGDSDADTIQNTIEAARVRGVNKVLIPRWNARRGATDWIIGHALALPSYMTVVLFNCYMRLEDFCYENMFCNTRATNFTDRCLSDEEHDITITGVGNAVLDGGRPNGLLEKTCFLNGFPDKRYNTTIRMDNVRNVVLENFQLRQPRWYGTYFIHCDTVRVSNIDMDCWEDCCNRDGVDMRSGCHNFLVENITGTTGDDTVAMNNLGNDGNDGRYVAGKDVDTMDVVIRNVKSCANRWFTVRLLDQDRHLEQNIVLDTIMDVSTSDDKKRVQTAVMVGSHEYHYKIPAELGDLAHITVRDVYARGTRGALAFGGFSDDVKAENLHVFSNAVCAVGVNKEARVRGVSVNGVFMDRDQRHLTLSGTADSVKDEPTGTVLDLSNLLDGEIHAENVFGRSAAVGVKLSGGGALTVKNFHADELSQAQAQVDAKSKLTVNGKRVKPDT